MAVEEVNLEQKHYLNLPLKIKEEDINEDGTFSGYASLFDNVPDSYGDLVAKGAFKKSLAAGGRNGTGVAMLWQHRSDQIPGVWKELKEDKTGLWSVGQLALDTDLGRNTYGIMKLGAKTGMFSLGQSIGYNAVKFTIDNDAETRTLTEINLWENSIVTFPAKLGATVTNVKSIEAAKTPRELETVLRESGLSRETALYLVKLCKPSLLRESDEGSKLLKGVLAGILEELKGVNSGF